MSPKRDIKYGDPTPCNLTKGEIERYATRVSELLQINPGIPLTDAVNGLGGRIEYQELDAWGEESGSIFVHGPRDFDILLPAYTSPRRDRFTIAHEIGHYLLHSNQGTTPLIARRLGSGRVEWEANWFAAGLLMPAELFRQQWGITNDVSLIALHFGVSREAAGVRKEVVIDGQ